MDTSEQVVTVGNMGITKKKSPKKDRLYELQSTKGGGGANLGRQEEDWNLVCWFGGENLTRKKGPRTGNTQREGNPGGGRSLKKKGVPGAVVG